MRLLLLEVLRVYYVRVCLRICVRASWGFLTSKATTQLLVEVIQGWVYFLCRSVDGSSGLSLNCGLVETSCLLVCI